MTICAGAMFVLFAATGTLWAQDVAHPFLLYSQGRYDEGEVALRNHLSGFRVDLEVPGRRSPELRAFEEGLIRQSRGWPREPGAAFLLEAAAHVFEINPSSAMRLLEAGCQKLRSAAQDDFELRWQRAAAALIQAPHSQRAQSNLPAGFSVQVPLYFDHLQHAMLRFPDDERLTLDWGIANESTYWLWALTTGVAVAERPRDAVPAAISAEINRFLTAASRAYTKVRNRPGVGAEATLRLGVVHLLQAKYADAMNLFETVPRWSRDDNERYLAALFAGRTLTARGAIAEAVVTYRQALRHSPHAQSATVALAGLLSASDPAEAAALIDTMLQSSPDSVDPWITYLDGDPSRWAVDLRLMRDRLR